MARKAGKTGADKTGADGIRAGETMTQVMFYHLEHSSLESVLPMLVEKTLERGWRAVVQADSLERVEALDALLWTFRDDSFIPHGTARDGDAGNHPVFLTNGEENANGATVRFLVDGADIEELSGYARIIYLFDGYDQAALKKARKNWKRARAAGCALTYWQQTEGGRWQKKADR